MSPLFGGIPASGAIARTATNVRSGAKTPVAGMTHALTLLCILLFAAPLAKFIPLSILAAILMIVSYNMGEWGEIPRTSETVSTRSRDMASHVRPDRFRRSYGCGGSRHDHGGTRLHSKGDAKYDGLSGHSGLHRRRPHILQDKDIPPYVTVFRIHGPFLFGATDKLEDVLHGLTEFPPIVILRLRNMTAIDATGLQALEEFADIIHASGRWLIHCGALERPAQMMHRADFEEHIGKENICANIQEALERAKQLSGVV
jgi:SulP family sulfate permease